MPFGEICDHFLLLYTETEDAVSGRVGEPGLTVRNPASRRRAARICLADFPLSFHRRTPSETRGPISATS